ncbi:MutS-related protein [Mariniradius sediminis]|uniref:DNA mismatch repair protein n=1 Tax=Mariniradius sediminis TaxID=2909237 RepID=A0ABS9BZF7_9BACT|nr:DNA mismatch repair protein [Mariniradius sediminis]
MKKERSQVDIRLELSKNKRKKHILSTVRIALFLCMVATFIIGATDHSWVLLVFAGLVVLFFRFVLAFIRVQDDIAFLEQLLIMDQETAKRKARNLQDFDSGTEFLDKAHPFANDLDLFGQHSLFQLLNHTVSRDGAQLLADWMKREMDADTALSRQSAIRELSANRDFTRSFEAIGRAFLKDEKSKKPFFQWLSERENWPKWYFIPTFIGPIGGMLLLAMSVSEVISPAWLGIWIIVGIGLMSSIFMKMNKISASMPLLSDLKTYKKWVEQLENTGFRDSYLNSLQQSFLTQHLKGSQILRELEQKTFLLQNRFNLMYLIANAFFWLDFLIYFRAIRWKKNHGYLMSDWEEKLKEWQVLVSLASFTFEEQLDVLPTWNRSAEVLAMDLKHPLILPNTAIGNDFHLGKEQKTVLLTGSNMSGKTTFMRTLGINMVLANLGLGIFGKKFEIGAFGLFTSMRNTDNLGESVSSFYAELGRIKKLLDMAANNQPIFYLLDEILKGTNTIDRIMGSEALIRQLAASPSKGIISTHDIELSQLEDKLPYVINRSFHSQIFEDKILFDYTLKEGPCPSFNAHKLMELMGIKFTE